MPRNANIISKNFMGSFLRTSIKFCVTLSKNKENISTKTDTIINSIRFLFINFEKVKSIL